MSEAMKDIDREIADALRMVQSMPRGMRRGMGRSMRPGSNHLRRMRTGQLVREHRRDVTRHDRGLERSSSDALAAELERRGLRDAAAEVRRGPSDQVGQVVATTAMGVTAAGIMSAAGDGDINEDREGERLEAAVDDRVAELAGPDLADLPVDSEREKTALTGDELAEDLVEVGAPVEALDAHDYAAVVAGDNPQEGIVAGLESHPPTLEFSPIQLDHTQAEEAEL